MKTSLFMEKLARIKEATQVKSESDLARVLGIHPSSVGAAKKREQIPPAWVEFVAEHFGINAHWLFFGTGEKYFSKSDEKQESTSDFKSIAAPSFAMESEYKSRESLFSDGKSFSAQSTCSQCQYLRCLLNQEQAERRELSHENRELWAKLCHLESEHARLLAFSDAQHKISGDSPSAEQVA